MWANAQRDGRPAEYRWRGALCSTLQSLADAMQYRRQDAKPVEICWGAPNSPTDLSRQWAEVRHIVRTRGGDIAV